MKYNTTPIVCLFLALISWDNSFCQNKYTYWINTDYLKCLNVALPCDCQKSSAVFNYIILGNSNEIVNSFWGIDKIELGNYKVSNYDKNKKQFNLEDIQGIFRIEKDKMTLKRGKILEKYLLFSSSDSLNKEKLPKQNLKIINSWLVKKYRKSVFDFLPYTSTCDCNYELGKVNLISIQGDDRFWILEKNRKDNSYSLFEDTAKNHDKVELYKFSKKLLFDFHFLSIVNSPEIVDSSEIPPEYVYGDGFIGGSRKYLEFIELNINRVAFPRKAFDDFVLISVSIDSLGNPINYSTTPIKNCSKCNEEALRIIKLVKKWIPPKKIYSKKTKQYFYLPYCYLERINF